jgi:uncharacterized protein (DUF1501 family)
VAKNEKAAKTAYTFPKVMKVEYLIHGVAIPDKERTHFDGPDPTRTGVVNVLVEHESHIGAILVRVAGLSPGETVEAKSSQVLVENVHTVAGGYDKQSTGSEPPKKAAKKSAKAKKAAPPKKAAA